MELGRARRRDHHRLGNFPVAGGHRAKGAAPDASCCCSGSLGGAVTLCGALSLGELAAALPETGGLYAYLREGWGRLAAFLFGWSELVLIRANALGGIAVVFGEYLLRSIGVDPVEHWIGARCLSAGAIAFAAAANIRGANIGAFIVGDRDVGEVCRARGARLLGLSARRQPRRDRVAT